MKSAKGSMFSTESVQIFCKKSANTEKVCMKSAELESFTGKSVQKVCITVDGTQKKSAKSLHYSR